MNMVASEFSGAWPSDGIVPFRLRPDLITSETTDRRSGKSRTFLKILATGQVFQLGPEEYFICRELDGRKSFAEVKAAFESRFSVALDATQLRTLVQELVKSGLLQRVEPGQAVLSAVPTPAETPYRRESRERIGYSRPSSPSEPDEAADDILAEIEPDTDRSTEEDEEEEEERRSRRFRWKIADPRPLLRVLVRLRRVRYLFWLIVPLVIAGVLAEIHHKEELADDFRAMSFDFAFFGKLLISLICVQMVPKLIQAAVAYGFGAQIDECGIRLRYGFLPRFYVGKGQIKGLSRRGQMWSYATAPMVRLVIFAIGTLIWANYLGTKSAIGDWALMIGQVALGTFIFTLNPLLPADAHNFLASSVGRRDLRRTSWRMLRNVLAGKPLPKQVSAREVWLLVSFAAAQALFLVVMISVAFFYMGMGLEADFGGTGVVLAIAASVLAAFYIYTVWIARQKGRVPRSSGADSSIREPAISTVVPLTRGAAGSGLTIDPRFDFDALGKKKPRWGVRAAWALVLAAALVIAFLPYPYSAGGEFTVLPNLRADVRARVEGEVMEVKKREGDWVEKGEVIAVLSDWDQRSDMLSAKAALEQAKAKLALIEHGPKQESIEAARTKVESAEVSANFARIEADRAASLLTSGTISQASADESRGKLESALADLTEAKAELALAQSGALQAEIDAQRAEVARLQNEYEFQTAQLERTRLTAPTEGQIVTPNIDLKVGTYLEDGGLFAELENNRVARVQVDVPETDIGVVEKGDEVWVRALGLEDTLRGNVVAIAPSAEERDYGFVVRVTIDVPNPDQQLKSNMTGYAKVAGEEMYVWQAFSRMLVRFFRIEMWSWIP
jgi:multidrug resistance efflux pump